jgi:type I site-specific restriction endonuclease
MRAALTRLSTAQRAVPQEPQEDTPDGSASAAGEKLTEQWLEQKAPASQWPLEEDKKNWRKSRIWRHRNLDGTKFAGFVRAADGKPNSNGVPDGILWDDGADWKTRDVLALVELKGDQSQIEEAKDQVLQYSDDLQKSGLKRVLGIAVAGNEESGVTVKVYKCILQHGVFVYKKVADAEDWFPTPADVERLLNVRALACACAYRMTAVVAMH